MVSLSLVAVIGLGLATNEGASLDLVPVLIGVFAFALALGSLFVYERPLHFVVTASLRASVALTGRPRGDTAEQIAATMAWMTAVRLRWTQIGRIVGWGTINWLLDCACFAMMFLAIHAPIPWKGLLLAYGAGQLAATLPITPGGLGVVEGSITVALVAFGGAEASTAYAVLLYRLISFWFILVVGWLFIGQLALQVRRGRWPRQAMTSGVEAGPEAYAPCDTARGMLVAAWPVTAGRGGTTGSTARRLVRRTRRPRRGGPLLTACSAARADLGTTDESCYLALPTAAKAVGGHAHLAGVRKYTLAGLRGVAPRLYGRMADDMPKNRDVCLAAYTGTSPVVRRQAARARRRHARRGRRHHPGSDLLGTLILNKLPVRFQHVF